MSLVLAALVPVLVLASVSLYEVEKQLRKQVTNDLRRESKELGTRVIERLSVMADELDLQAAHLLASRLEAREGLAAEIFSDRQRFQGLYLLTEGGGCTTLAGLEVARPLTLEHTRAQEAHLVAGNAVLSVDEVDETDGEFPRLLLVRKVDPASRENRFIVGDIHPRYLWGDEFLPKSSPVMELCVFDRRHRLLFSSRPVAAAAGRLLSDVDPSAEGKLEWRCGNRDYVGHLRSVPQESRFRAPDWDLILFKPRENVLAEIAGFKEVFLFLVAVTLAAVLVGSVYLIRRSLEPLEKLKEGTTRIAVRDFDSPIAVRSGDEFEDLADSFNSMARELKKQFDTLTSLLGDLESANSTKNLFLANMSHELRTPLTAILGCTELLAMRFGVDAEAREDFAIVERNCHHLLEIINDILDITRLEAEKMSTRREPTSPRALLQEVLAIMRTWAERKNLRLEGGCEEDVPESIDSDSTRIQQILTNLIGNAIKFTDAGSVDVRVRLRHEPGHNGVELLEFSVADTGIGIPEAMLKDIFKPFTQVDPTNTRKYGGTGLGLAICHGLVRLLKGTLHLESREGKGSTFSFVIPCERSEPVARLPDVPAVGEEPPPASVKSPLSPHSTILIVEDTRDSQIYLSRALKRLEGEVVLASDGAQALQICSERELDLVLMDIRMPNLDGFQTLAELRRRGCSTPVIALTAHAMAGDREACLEAGFVDYVSKPVSAAVLVEKVEECLSRPGKLKTGIRYSRHASDF